MRCERQSIPNEQGQAISRQVDDRCGRYRRAGVAAAKGNNDQMMPCEFLVRRYEEIQILIENTEASLRSLLLAEQAEVVIVYVGRTTVQSYQVRNVPAVCCPSTFCLPRDINMRETACCRQIEAEWRNGNEWTSDDIDWNRNRMFPPR